MTNSKNSQNNENLTNESDSNDLSAISQLDTTEEKGNNEEVPNENTYIDEP